jgi:hypothetical protein
MKGEIEMIVTSTPTVGNPESFSDQLLAAVPTLRVPPSDPDGYALWERAFAQGCDGIPASPGPELSRREAAIWHFAYGDGLEVWHRETCEVAEREAVESYLARRAESRPAFCGAFGLNANEYEGL